jgi:hypothetical protein
MKYFATLFAIASMAATGIRADPIEGHQFTVNLVTDVWDLSVTSPGSQVAIHFNNATIKHSFWNKTYSIVGGLVFNDTKAMQTYAVHTDQWQKTVSSIATEPSIAQGHDGLGTSLTEMCRSTSPLRISRTSNTSISPCRGMDNTESFSDLTR